MRSRSEPGGMASLGCTRAALELMCGPWRVLFYELLGPAALLLLEIVHPSSVGQSEVYFHRLDLNLFLMMMMVKVVVVETATATHRLGTSAESGIGTPRLP